MFFVFLLMFSFLLCEKQFADGVVATVGSRVVLFSDVLEETNLLAQQQQINPSSNPYLFDRLFDSVLNQQINKKAILSFVDIDSSLVVKKYKQGVAGGSSFFTPALAIVNEIKVKSSSLAG